MVEVEPPMVLQQALKKAEVIRVETMEIAEVITLILEFIAVAVREEEEVQV